MTMMITATANVQMQDQKVRIFKYIQYNLPIQFTAQLEIKKNSSIVRYFIRLPWLIQEYSDIAQKFNFA